MISLILTFSLCATFLQGRPAKTGPCWSSVVHAMLTWITSLLCPLPPIPGHNFLDMYPATWGQLLIPVEWLLHCPQVGGCGAQLCLVAAGCSSLCMSATSSWLEQIRAASARWRCFSFTHRHRAGRKVLNTRVCSSATCLP